MLYILGYKNYYGDSEYLDQGLNKYSGHHKRDKYGAKSDTHKDFHDTHVYTRNRGYGYEKHYMFDKEYSTGKKVGTNKGKHSFFGDHDHGSKVTIDAHKNYDSKKYSNKNLAAVDPYEPIGIISNNHHNNDYSIIDDHIDQGLSDHGYHDGGKTNLLNKHKKELHKIKKHFENHHHIHHSPQPIAYAKVHEYIPVIESYGGIVPTSVPSTSTYGTHSLIEPYEHKYYPKSAYTIQPIHQSPESSLYDDTLYLSSASDDQKTNQYIKPNMDTEGESVNTLNARLLSTSQSGSALSTSSSSALPTSSSIPITTASKSAKIVNTAPLISTRLMPIVDGSAASLSSSTSTSTTTTLSTLTNPRIALAESSFPKIQSAVHATPAIIATHMYKH